MRKKYIFGKKLYISILTTIVVLLTTVATTFAWVGVFANSTFDQFNISIKASSLEEYGIVISASGEDGTFSDSIDNVEIKRQILKNWGYEESEIDRIGIEPLFSGLNLEQCTNLPVVKDNKIERLGNFKTIEGYFTKRYYSFDIYAAPVRFYEKSYTSDYKMDIYLNEGLLSGGTKRMKMKKKFTYPSSFINPLNNLPSGIIPIVAGDIVEDVTVNSKSATRVAFEKYEVVDLYDTSAYEGKKPINTIIYSGDCYDYPTYNSSLGIYEFGGILPDNVNLAVDYYNSYEYTMARNNVYFVSVPDDIYSIRGVTSATKDKTFHSTTNHLIDSNIENEQVAIGKMIKLKVSFWIEGWDADCFNILNQNPITLSISMGIANEIEF